MAKPFVKGDPRINRKGRPRNFDGWRELAQQIAHEPAEEASGAPVVVDGHVVTRGEQILRDWAMSKDPRKQLAFAEYAYGKVPQQTEIAGENGGPIKLLVEYVNRREG